MSTLPRPRPVFLDPLKVHLPVTATVSLAHRISGLLLIAALPLLAWALDASLSGQAAIAPVLAALDTWPARGGLVLLVWALVHHAAAGIRHLLFDAGRGTAYATARTTAWLVHAVAAVAALAALGAASLRAWPWS